MPSFDIVSKVELQEVRNAVIQVQKELATRYDFRGSKTTIELLEKELMIVILADDQMKLSAVQELLRQKFAKRGVSVKCVEFKESAPAGGDMVRQEVLVKQGLKDEELKGITKSIKNGKFKVNAQIQGDQVRVTGKSRDELQTVIAHVRGEMKELELQFVNFRE